MTKQQKADAVEEALAGGRPGHIALYELDGDDTPVATFDVLVKCRVTRSSITYEVVNGFDFQVPQTVSRVMLFVNDLPIGTWCKSIFPGDFVRLTSFSVSFS